MHQGSVSSGESGSLQQEKETMMQQQKEALHRFINFVRLFEETSEYKIQNPSPPLLGMFMNLWQQRRVLNEEKRLHLRVTLDQDWLFLKEEIVDLMVPYPSIVLYINEEQIPNSSFIKTRNNKYYEGTQERMRIVNLAHPQRDRYEGPVLDLDSLEEHGMGIMTSSISTSSQSGAYVYEGEFREGMKEGFGRMKIKNTIFVGTWVKNVKQGFGKEYHLRKRNRNPAQINNEDPAENSSRSEQPPNEHGADSSEGLPDSQAPLKMESFETKPMSQQPMSQQPMSQQQPMPQQPKNLIQSGLECDFGQMKEGNDYLQDLQKSHLISKQFKSLYQGYYSGGVRCGQGTEITKHGVYKGSWSEDMKNQFGTMKYFNGAVYEGEWKNNLREGKGKYTDEKGNVYQGEFSNGVFEGEGTMTYVKGDVYQGNWHQGKRHGQGIYTWADEDYYDGEWVKDYAEGQGTSMTSGIYFVGTFKKGKKHGLGEETNEDGETIQGLWEDNKCIEKITVNGEVPESDS